MCVLLVGTGCHSSNGQLARIQAGEQALEQRDFATALAAADGALAAGDASTLARALYLKGQALEQRPKRDAAASAVDLREAWRCYAAAIDSGPSRLLEGYARASLANVAYWLEEFATAEQQWGLAYNLIDDADLRAWVLYRRGLCLQRLGRWPDADATYALVTQQFPDTEPARRAAARAGARAFYVQVGAFANTGAAQTLAGQLRSRGFAASTSPAGTLQRVLVGPFAQYAEAATARTRLATDYPEAVVIP